jgi:hypothetical protein
MNYQKIFKNLEQTRCKSHKLKPIIVPKGESVAYVCCCENFKKELIKKIDNETARQTRVELIDEFVFFN